MNAHVFQKICVLKQIQLKKPEIQLVETKSDNLQTKLKCFVNSDNERTKCKTGYYPKVESKDIKYWACGSKCEGKQYLTTTSCKCACIKESECSNFRPSKKEENELVKYKISFKTNNNSYLKAYYTRIDAKGTTITTNEIFNIEIKNRDKKQVSLKTY